MSHYVAFLRAINIRGRIIKMAQLSAAFIDLGFKDVATFIASGNVVFKTAVSDTRKVEQRIERALDKELGYHVATFIRTTREVAALAEYRPFASDANANETLYVGFLHDAPPANAVQRLLSLRTATDDFHVHDRHVFWLCRLAALQTKFSGAALERALGMPATLRNINTVRRLAARYPPLARPTLRQR